MSSRGKSGLQRARVKFTDDVDQTALDYPQPSVDFPKDKQKQNAEQNRKPRSWLFQGWRSKNSTTEDVKGSSSVMVQRPVNNPRDHSRYREDESLPGFTQSVPPAASRGGVEANNTSEEPDEEEVDKDAEYFIEKMRQRMDIERWKSMKRYESMLNRSC